MSYAPERLCLWPLQLGQATDGALNLNTLYSFNSINLPNICGWKLFNLKQCQFDGF